MRTPDGLNAGMSNEGRLDALDILRGLALFGMIVVHFHQKTRREVSGLEDLIGWAVYIFVEQKAWGTFAFLFGAGFAILLRRLERRGAPVVSTYLRRMAALALFGVVAEVGFGFHILFSYACCGLVLLLIRAWSTSALLLTAAIAAAAKPVVGELLLLTGGAPTPPATAALSQAVQAAAEQSHYLTLLGARWALFIGSFPHTWRGLLPDINLALFILGLLAVRHDVLDSPLAHRRRIVRWMVAGALAWACSWLVLGQLPALGVEAHWPVVYGFGLVQDQWLCLTYIGATVLLLAHRPIWVTRLALFGDAGRMALTNYMVQAVVLDALSSGYGWGLRLRPLAYLPAAIVLFAVETRLSRAWLRRFRIGPLEWLWRTMTYAAPQPLRRAVTPSTAARL